MWEYKEEKSLEWVEKALRRLRKAHTYCHNNKILHRLAGLNYHIGRMENRLRKLKKKGRGF